jgi:predicted nucleic acid-binding protein
MLLVVDTSVLIDHLRADPRALAVLRDAVEAGHEMWSVTVVRTEILAGARPNEIDRIAALLAHLRWVDVTVELADAAGELAARYLRSHRGVDTVDYLVAAATQSLGARLLTLNVRHFPMFPDLTPAYSATA